MKNIIKTLLVVMVLVLAITALTGCEQECTHANTEFVLGVEPTCTEDGLTSGFKCKDCGEWVVPQEVDPAGHDYVVDMDGLDPTCTEDGYTDYKKCGRCDAIDGKEVVPNLGGHKMEAVEAKETGCEENPGYNAHNACSVCGYSEDRVYTTYGEDGGHTFAEENTFVYEAPTCTEVGLLAGYCSTCGNAYLLSYIPATGHVDENGDFVCDVEGCGAYVNPYFAAGTGTEEDPFIIETAEQLANISLFYDTYKYYKVADGVETIDMTGVGKINLHGSFDGNGVKLVNLTTALFLQVGYQNSVEEIKISNIDATLNNLDGCAFVRNIFNGGKTIFENVHIHGYIEGLYNMGSFYNYGTANCDGIGADYTVEFINSTSDATLVCTSGNVAGGFLGHSYEGAGKAFTMIIDADSAFTGKILTTNGKGNLYFAMTSDYNNTLNKFIVAGEEVHFNNGNIPAAANLGKIVKVVPTVGENGYEVAPVEGVASYVVYLNAQVTAYDEEGYKIPNKNGLTWPLGHFDLDTLAGYGLITDAKIVNGTDREFGYEIVDGVLTIYSGRSASYESGNVVIQINQYDAEGNLLATGTLTVYVIEHNHTFVGQSCTEGGVCNCGTKGKALGHDYDHITHDATCTAAGYVEHICAVCDDTYTDGEVAALGHADENGDYKCDRCSTKMLPADGTTLTIPQALAVAKVAGTTYTTQKYYITGIVTNVYNTTYGNLYLKDAEGNQICIYGLYTWDKAVRYDKMEYKPVEGDELTVYTVLGMYNTTCQGKDAWMDDVVAHEHDYKETVTAPGCLTEGYTTHTCSICKASYVDGNTAALGHTTDAGTCERCGLEIGGDAPVVGTLATFDFGANGSASHVDGNDYGSSKSFTSGTYTLALTGMSKVYGPAYDAKGNSCIKLGTSKLVGTFSFTVPENVTEVIIYVAKYKTNSTTIKVNGTSYTLTKNSDNGEYDVITIDTTTTKTVTLTTVASTYRAMVNTIVFNGTAN